MTTRAEFEEEWCRVQDAPERVHKSLRTIYYWIKDGRVRSARPLHDLWVYVPDLLKAEQETHLRRTRRVG